MRTSISFSGGELLVKHLAWRQCPLQHVFVFWFEVIKFNFSGAQKRVQDEVLVINYVWLVEEGD